MRETVRWVAVAGGLGVALSGLGWLPVEAQQPSAEGFDWMPASFGPSGQPVVPLFEGWYQNPDGTHEMCFGYWSGNTQETVLIPLGPDNFIEPAEYDGSQPTEFRPRPNTGWRRYYCTFTVQVPEDFGTGDVTWTIRNHGQTYSVPGHLTVSSEMLDEPIAPARASSIQRDVPWNTTEGYGSWQGSIAPRLEFVEPRGPSGVGRNGVTAGPVQARVGQPVTLQVRVGSPDGRDTHWWVGWSEHQGPAPVGISQREMEADPTTNYLATTVATFAQPGEYVILIQAIESIQSFERFCCWTNGYVNVTVAR